MEFQNLDNGEVPRKLPGPKSYTRNWSVVDYNFKDVTERVSQQLFNPIELQINIDLKNKDNCQETEERKIEDSSSDDSKDSISDDCSKELIISTHPVENIKDVVLESVPVTPLLECENGNVQEETFHNDEECEIFKEKEKKEEKHDPKLETFGLNYGAKVDLVFDCGVTSNLEDKMSEDCQAFVKENEKVLIKYDIDDGLFGYKRKVGYEKRFDFNNNGLSDGKIPVRYKVNDPFEDSDGVVFGIYGNSKEYPLFSEFKFDRYYNAILPPAYDYTFCIWGDGRNLTDRLEFGMCFVRSLYNLLQFRISKDKKFESPFILIIYLCDCNGRKVKFKHKRFNCVKNTEMEKDRMRRSRKRKRDKIEDHDFIAHNFKRARHNGTENSNVLNTFIWNLKGGNVN